jgi:hypothetical protein
MKLLRNPSPSLAAVFFTIAIIIFSCKKETSGTSAEDETEVTISATESNAEAEDIFNGVFDDVLGVNADVGLGSTGIFGRRALRNYETTDRIDNTNLLPPCLNLIIMKTSPNAFPVTVTFNFGSYGCIANDGHWRKGKIIINYSDRLLNLGAMASVSFDDFSIDSIAIDDNASYTITNTGTLDNLQFTVDISAKLSKPNNNYSEWHSHKIISRTEGNLTQTPLDDVLKMEGNASGKVKKNDLVVAWKSEITDPFIKKFTCHWFSKGVMKTRRENLSSNSQWAGILDYGAGNCDNRASLTINGISYEITLR